MDKQHSKQVLYDFFESSCLELFSDLQLLIDPQQYATLSSSHIPTATIDAGTKDFEVIVSLSMPYTTLEATYPVLDASGEIPEEMLEDWVAELANRLLGKFNTKLNARNVRLNVGLPVFSEKADGSLDETDNTVCYDFYFEIELDITRCRIVLEFLNDNININDADQEGYEPPVSGTIDFF